MSTNRGKNKNPPGIGHTGNPTPWCGARSLLIAYGLSNLRKTYLLIFAIDCMYVTYKKEVQTKICFEIKLSISKSMN